MKIFNHFFALVVFLLCNLPFGFGAVDPYEFIFRQHQLEQEGKKFERMGDYDGAIQKYNLAVEYDKKINGDPRGRPLSFIVRTLQKQGKYEEALEKLEYLKSGHEKHERYSDWEQELKALIEYKKTNRADFIYKHVNYLKQKYKNIIPPIAYDGIFGVIAVESILRLCDAIGDHDAGIKFIDEILAYFRTGKAGDPKPGKVDAEYMKVREAFEKDKAEGTKGRATKALIQSDYFPW